MSTTRLVAALALALVPAWSLAQRPAISIAVDARAIEPGEVLRVTIKTTSPADLVRVRAFDRGTLPYRVDALTWGALVGVDLDITPGTYPLTAEAIGPQPGHATHDLVVRPHAFPTRRLTVDNAYVNPPPETQARITREADELSRIWTGSADERLWAGAFVRPVPQPANSAFGTRSIFNGEARSPHGGADFLSPAGTPIHSPNAGRVVLARELYFTGNTVVVDHGLGLVSLMAHLSEIEVAEGAAVTTGQVLGKVGATGRVTGAHLHWTVRLNGARVDPLSLLSVLAGTSSARGATPPPAPR